MTTKVPAAEINVPDITQYVAMLSRHSTKASSDMYVLSSAQIEFYRRNQYLKCPNLLPCLAISPHLMQSYIDEIAQWEVPAHGECKWLIHFEVGADGVSKQLCRAENFVNFHEPLSDFCRGQAMISIISSLFDEPAHLFKEKINFKMPNGAGFATHQDSPAYISLAKSHITALVAVDAFTQQNGCLQVAPGVWEAGQVPLTAGGIVTPEAEAGMRFVSLACSPGDVVFFSGYIPHRSDKNSSSASRRGLFLTYNPASEGDFHKVYYEAKHSGLNGFDGGTAISFQDDFLGKIVE